MEAKRKEDIIRDAFPVCSGITCIGWHQMGQNDKNDVLNAMQEYAEQQTQQLQQELTEAKAERMRLHGCIDDIFESDQKAKAENERLREALTELWPLATNAFAELTIDEVKQDGILSRLSDAIDKAKNALNNNRIS